MAATSSCSETSALITAVLLPRSAICRAASSASVREVRKLRTTSAPACASRSAHLRPMPREEPVTRATFPLKLIKSGLCPGDDERASLSPIDDVAILGGEYEIKVEV